jgi:hypothetical protein
MKKSLFATVSLIVFGVLATACGAGGEAIDGPSPSGAETAPSSEAQAADEAREDEDETGVSASALSSCSNHAIDPGGCYSCGDLTNKAASFCAARGQKYAGGACSRDACKFNYGYIKFTCC